MSLFVLLFCVSAQSKIWIRNGVEVGEELRERHHEVETAMENFPDPKSPEWRPAINSMLDTLRQPLMSQAVALR
ncbi:MAG: hypothetical protein JKX97_06880 [Candidatus Lindowbacteria bacterium]|nr:hypothetical protein [Candidatus Lindowbacteria bacterium]